MTLDTKSIAYWSKYLSKRQFTSEQEARDFIFRRLEIADKEYGCLFGVSGPAKNRAIADAMPVYQLRTCWKVGKPSLAYTRKPRWTWDSCSIRSTPHEEIVNTAYANETCAFTIRRKCLIPIRKLGIHPTPDGDRYASELPYIRRLADQIRTDDGWFECVIVGTYNMKEFWLIEGQHRTRAAAWVLRQTSIPADVIVYEQSVEEAVSPSSFLLLCEGISIVPWSEYSDNEEEAADPWEVLSAAENVFNKAGIRLRRDGHLLCTAQIDGQVVGAAFGLARKETDDDRSYTEFTFDVAVLPQHQGATVGYELMKAAIRIGKMEGDGEPVLCKQWCINKTAADMLEHLFGFENRQEHGGYGERGYSCTMEKWL